MLKKESSLDVFEYLADDTINAFANYETDDLLELGNLDTINSQGSLVVLSPEISEETLDIAARPDQTSNEEVAPISPRGPPSRSVFPGPLNFSVEINAEDTHRKKYLYSHQLNRIYVDLKTDFPVQFRWERARAPAPLYVRATAVFWHEAEAEKRVERCIQHTHESANADVDARIVNNVLRSSRAPGTAGVRYCGEPALPDSWYSVLVRLGARDDAAHAHAHAFRFVCKNSCSTGINRRAIGIVFTLEDQFGQVYGRQAVGARVCACPKRDKLKDEEAAGECPGKRRAPPPPRDCKRVKLEPGLVQLPPLSIVGVKTVVTGLEVMLSMMEQLAAAKRHDPQAAELYQGPITSLRSQIEKYKELPQSE